MRNAIMLLILLSASLASGYIIVDYDDMDYVASGQAQMEAAGWHNDSAITSTDVWSVCSVGGSDLSCIGLNAFLHRPFNQVPSTYSIENQGAASSAKNFSVRFKWKPVAGSYSSSAASRREFQMWDSYTASSTRTNGFAVVYNNSGVRRYGLYGDTNFYQLFSTNSTDFNYYDFQMDFRIEATTAAAPNLSWQNITLWSSGTSGIWNSTLAPTGTMPNLVRFNSTNFIWVNGRGFYLDDWAVIVYDNGEDFILPNQSLNFTTSYNCSDGLDNDDDGYIDLDDPNCDDILDNIEDPFDTHACNDGADNDGDGFTDFPSDPSCASLFGDTELPQSYFICSDGIDNDGDGFIDLDDPACVSANGSTELPMHGSGQPDDTCAVSSLCLIKDTFPYVDDFVWHGWEYDYIYEVLGVPTPVNCTTGNTSGCNQEASTGSMNLATSNNQTIFYKDFTNANTYNDAEAYFRIVMDGIGLHPESVNISINNGGTDVVRIYLDIDRENTYTIGSSQYDKRVGIYASSGGFFYLGGYAYLHDLSIFELYAMMDNTENTFSIRYKDATSLQEKQINTTFSFDNNLLPDNIVISTNAQYNEIMLHEAHIYGYIPSIDAYCTTWSRPKYLYETFNSGNLLDCGWITNQDISVLGDFNIKNDDGEINAYKVTSLDGIQTPVTSKISDYVTIQWDEYIDSTSDDGGNTNAIFIQDHDYNVISMITFDKGTGGYGRVYTTSDGDTELVTDSFPNDMYNTMKVVINLVSDSQTIIIDDVLYASDAPLKDSAYDFTDVAVFAIGSYNSQYRIDNVIIYTSDAEGNQIVPNQFAKKKDSNETILFGIVFQHSPTCLTDEDCASGWCARSYSAAQTGRCHILNYRACDEAGYNRTMWCFFKLFIGGGLNWFKDLILDNMILFLVFLIIVMAVLFFIGQFRRR
jgi:hypothetical protein